MNDENDKKSTEAQPRKLLLGKRVLRHFNVRSSIQTGAMNSAEPTASTDGGQSVTETTHSYTIGQRTR